VSLTRDDLAKKLRDYLQHRLTLSELVDWAEGMMMDADFEEQYVEQLREVTARLGLADVKNFGLTWESCENLLRALGYRAQIDIVPSEPLLQIAEESKPYGKKEQ